LQEAASQYRAAFDLLPERRSVLLDLARVAKARGDAEGEMAALLAASRGAEPRTAELAKERIPARYPFVYEFRKALELDPGNSTLHRELAYLLLSMSESGAASKGEARREFEDLAALAETDYLVVAQLGLLYLSEGRETEAMPLLQRVLDHGEAAIANRVRMALKLPLVLEERSNNVEPVDARIMGERSYASGFFRDALKYFTAAREENPVDAAIALKLAWTNNLLHDDRTALGWFKLARHSDDPAIAKEASNAYENLRPGLKRVQTTLWMYPLLSTRWSDAFGYGQIKTELRWKFVKPYASVRYSGDVRRYSAGVTPQSLSESAFIFAVGATTAPWHGLLFWGEGGRAMAYVNGLRWADYRAGLSWSATHHKSGWFLENTADSVFVSHFANDWINYSQNRLGRQIRRPVDAFLGANITFDAQRQYWANSVELGPGLRFRPKILPKNSYLTVSAVRGIYLINTGNPRGPNYNDVRVGFWYAFTR
jgi:tetratricopeptide (TPR) repeat protein